jgi:large subunit ribosomal protein L19
MTTKLIEFNKKQVRNDLPEIRPGMEVRIHERIKEGEKERIQVFKGIVLAVKHGRGVSSTITVRSIVAGVGVERIWPLNSPKIQKIEIVRASKVRRAKLYFLRKLSPKKIKRKLSVFKDIVVKEPEKEEIEEEEIKETKEEKKEKEEDKKEEVKEEKDIKEDKDKKEEMKNIKEETKEKEEKKEKEE